MTDSKRPNCGTFILGKEDHTIGTVIIIIYHFLSSIVVVI